MSRKISLNFPLYENVYGSDMPSEQYYIMLFDTLPSKNATKKSYSNEIVEYFKEIGFIEETRITLATRNLERSCQMLLINREKQIMINTHANLIKDPDLLTFDILYNIQNGELHSQLNVSKIREYIRRSKKSNIQLVRSDMGHLDTEEYDLFVPEIDLELNYGKDFVLIHNNIVERLNTNYDKGIILLHGDPGTGKTTYLKYLTKQIREKNVLFIPPSMAELLSEPSIIPFLMENKNSILLIEDAERVIADRDGRGSPSGVSNLLNLTDGILGDCLNIQVIATFNMNREKIDNALLRKGRLIAEHKFEKLTVENANKLLNHIGKNHISKEPMTLADIYNVDSPINRITKEYRKLGF